MARRRQSCRTQRSISGCSISPPAPTFTKLSGKASMTLLTGGRGRQKRFSKNSVDAMAYRVELTIRAQQDLNYIFDRITADDSAIAGAWYSGLQKAIRTLANLPRRCPINAESRKMKAELRHLLYGSKPDVYRVIYDIDESRKLVRVITIWHAARDEFLK
jgi:toxin ParE1/3/4